MTTWPLIGNGKQKRHESIISRLQRQEKVGEMCWYLSSTKMNCVRFVFVVWRVDKWGKCVDNEGQPGGRWMGTGDGGKRKRLEDKCIVVEGEERKNCRFIRMSIDNKSGKREEDKTNPRELNNYSSSHPLYSLFCMFNWILIKGFSIFLSSTSLCLHPHAHLIKEKRDWIRILQLSLFSLSLP